MWLVLAIPVAQSSGKANTGEAQGAIAQAEGAVASARAQNALWTSAEEALRLARRALEGGDPAGAIRHAEFAAAQAHLGIAQKQLPLTR